MQVNRLFEIIYVLLSKRMVTARELAERFEVSQRTIYRDIDTLSLAGIPVYTEKGKGGGISLMPEFVMSKSILSEQEQNEILSALQGLSKVKTSETDGVLRKLSAIFNKTAVSWLEVDFSDWSFANGSLFSDFKTAILERRIARFDYYSTFGESTRREIEPIQLWFKSKAWYIKGFCPTRQDIRIFKLTRIRRLTITDKMFTERKLLEAKADSGPVTHRKQDVTIKLRIAPEAAYRVYDEFDDDMAARQPDGSFIVTVTWPEDEWVYGTILSYGERAEVLEPESLRDIIRDRALRTADKYL